MKLTLTFDSIEEFEAFRAAARDEARAAETPAEKPKAPAEAAELPAETPEATEGKTPAPKQKKAAKAEPAAEEVPLQAVRKALADLNKATGVNRAAEIIRELTGKERLTDTAPEDWPKIVARAEEELHAD